MTTLSEVSVEAILVDLDGTLCDTRHRDHIISNSKGEPVWDDHSMKCVDDDPISSTMVLIDKFHRAGYYIVLCSGRGEVARPQTEEWLEKWAIPYDELILREEGDIRNNAAYKWAHITELREKGVDVELVIDDYYKVRELVEDVHGIPVMQVKSYTAYGEKGI